MATEKHADSIANCLENYHLVELVGEGSFGKVYKARRKYTGKVVAMKFINKHGKSDKDIKSLRQEIEILKGLRHENIIHMIDNFETSSEFCVITEFAQGELFEVIEDDQCLPEEEVQNIAKQLVRALHYLHSNRIIHRDMKPQNILIGTGRRVKLCDFGFARAMSSTTLVLTSIKGTPLYMAPELVQEQPYDLTVDLWSLGVILYELYVGKPPFYTNNIYGLIQHIIKDQVKYPAEISDEFSSFLRGLLNKKPQERLSWPDLLQHPFVKDNIQVTEPTPPKLVAQPKGPTENELRGRRRERQEKWTEGGGKQGQGVLSRPQSGKRDERHKPLPEVSAEVRENQEECKRILEAISEDDTTRRGQALDVLSGISKLSPRSKEADVLPHHGVRGLLAACRFHLKKGRMRAPTCRDILVTALVLLDQIEDKELKGFFHDFVQLLWQLVNSEERLLSVIAAAADVLRTIVTRLGQECETIEPPSRRENIVHQAVLLCAKQRKEDGEDGNDSRRSLLALLVALVERFQIHQQVANAFLQKSGSLRYLQASLVEMESARRLFCHCVVSHARLARQLSDAETLTNLKHVLQVNHVTAQDAGLVLEGLKAITEAMPGESASALLEEGIVNPICIILHRLVQDPSWGGDWRERLAPCISQILHGPLDTPAANKSGDDDAVKRFQEVLRTENVVGAFTEALPHLSLKSIQPALGLVARLALSAASFARQYIEAGGLSEELVGRLLNPSNPPAILIDELLTVSQLARVAKTNYERIQRAGVCERLLPLIPHSDSGVRARSCNLIGNMCRHSAFFYSDIARHDMIPKLIERCHDDERTVRKFACFAIGNAGFHSDTLYPSLRLAIPSLTKLLSDSESKTRANAAGALGNLVRNSSLLCAELISQGAIEGLTGLIESASKGSSQGESDSQSPLKIALFSLGNLCTHDECKTRLTELDVWSRVHPLSKSPDPSVRKYVLRIESKLSDAGAGVSSRPTSGATSRS